MVGQVLRKVRGVVPGAVDKAGLAPPQHCASHEIETWRRRDASVVTDLTFRVEDRDIQPRVVGAKAGCPEHRLDLTRTEREQQWRVVSDLRAIETLWVVDLMNEPAAVHPGIEGVQQPIQLEVRQRA